MEAEKAAGDLGQRNGIGLEIVNESSDSGKAADLDGKVGSANDRTGGGQGHGESSNEGVVPPETVILITCAENLNVEEGKLSKGDKESSFVIDVKCKDSWDGEKVCRICHLGCEAATGDPAAVSVSSMELIQLGCGCKDELGVAHAHCGEAWFKLKGNRVCEICGETAKNITGVVGDGNGFLEEWNHVRFINGGDANSLDRRGGCWRAQPLCNFLMACLVIAFVLPWFFRVNMF
ncbi:hypothetical protein LINPERHAP1_LOCUS38548 [Linum perenne]